jgi:hypothetical protein
MNLGRTIGNILGYLSILISAFLWTFALSTGLNELPNPRIEMLLILGLFLPPFAARRNPKWWLLMLLSPIAWYIVFKFSLIPNP